MLPDKFALSGDDRVLTGFEANTRAIDGLLAEQFCVELVEGFGIPGHVDGSVCGLE